MAERVDGLEWQELAIITGSASGEKNPETLTTQKIVRPVTDAKSKYDLRSKLHSTIRGGQDVNHVDNDANYSRVNENIADVQEHDWLDQQNR